MPFVVPEQAAPLAQVTDTVTEAAYPKPANVTTVPTGPVAGLATSFGAAVRVATAVLLDASVPVKVCPPAVVAGSTNVQLNAPSTLVTTPLHAVPPLQLTVTDELG